MDDQVYYICETCGKTFYEDWRKNLKSRRKSLPRFCSRSCSNTRVFSIETKEKMSKSSKGNIHVYKGKVKNKNGQYVEYEKSDRRCKICGEPIGLTAYKNTRMCLKCLYYTKEHRDKISNVIKEQYNNGKKVYGGLTKWYDYGSIRVQGTYEYRVCFILDEMKRQGEIESWEYTNERIPYIGPDNEKHLYLLDFKVDDFYIEVKGYIQDLDFYKWKGAKEQNIILYIWMLNDIQKNEKRLSITK